MALFTHSPSKTSVKYGLEIASTDLVVVTTTIPSTQPSSKSTQLNITLTEVRNTSSTEQLVPPSSSLTEKKKGIHVVSVVSTCVANPSFSIVTSIPSISTASTMKIENQSQLITTVLDKWKQIISTILKEKGKERTIDLAEDIVILNWDSSNVTLDQMNIMGELLKKKGKQQNLREEKKEESKF